MPRLPIHERESAPAPFYLRALGPLELSRADAEYSRTFITRQGKLLAPIVYLASASRRSASREMLLHLVWENPGAKRPRQALSQALSSIKALTGVELIASNGDLLVLSPLVATDVDAFEHALAEGRAADAVALYAGEFCEGFASPGAGEFERWCDRRRAFLRERFSTAARQLLAQRRQLGDVDGAVSLARRVRDLDHRDPEGWHLLLDVLAQSRPDEARAEGDSLLRLASEDEVDLTPALASLVRVVRGTPGAVPRRHDRHGSVDVPLVGRSGAVTHIVNAWREVREGALRVVHLTGPSGIGKTRLLREAAHRLRLECAREPRQVDPKRIIMVGAAAGGRGRAFALAGDVAFSIAHLRGATAVSPLARAELVGLHEGFSTFYDERPKLARDDESSRRRSQAVRELFREVVHGVPLAIFVDDVHWGDDESRELLAAAFVALEGVPLLVVTAGRDAPAGELPGLESHRIDLGPLTARDVESLLASLGTLPSAEVSHALGRQLWQASGGSPLELVETLQLLVDHGHLALGDGAWRLVSAEGVAHDLARGPALAQRLAALSADARALLVHLSVARRALSAEALSTVIGVDDRTFRHALLELETRGFILPRNGGWQVGHDAVATKLLEHARTGEEEAAHRSLARHLAERHEGREAALVAGVQHAVAAGDWPLAEQVFRQFVSSRRALGDRRGNAQLARDALHRDDPIAVKRLLRALPLSYRVGLFSAPRLALSSVVTLVTAMGALTTVVALRSAPPAPDETLVVFGTHRSEPTTLRGYRVPVRASAWEGSSVEIPWKRGRAAYRVPSFDRLRLLAHSATGEWVAYAATHDSGSIDVYAVAADGDTTRLTHTPGDDGGPATSPDGRFVAFATDRWNRQARYDLAILERATGAVRQVTEGSDADGPVAWHPDGTRLGFIRRYWDERRAHVCSVAVDGTDLTCLAPNEGGYVAVHGWFGDRQLIVTRRDGDSGTLELLDLTRGTSRPLADVSVFTTVAVSDDGRWIACRCAMLGVPEGAYVAFPSGRPDAARVLQESGGDVVRTALWEHSPRVRYVERVRILEVDTVRLGVPHKLRASLVTADGRVRERAPVRWRVADTTMATIDSVQGVLFAKRPGPVTVHASAGGWRSDTLSIQVVPAVQSELLLTEDWSSGLDAWWASGNPAPIVVRDRQLQSAFLNNGDGTFRSGVVSRVALDARHGVSLDVALRGRLDRDQWQELFVALLALPDDDTLDAIDWTDDRSVALATLPRCVVAFPEGDGVAAGRVRAAVGGVPDGDGASWPLTSAERAGSPLSVTLHVFPDGRCGARLGNRPPWLSAAQLPPASRLRVALYGNSVGTRLLAGPLRARTGVGAPALGSLSWYDDAAPRISEPSGRVTRPSDERGGRADDDGMTTWASLRLVRPRGVGTWHSGLRTSLARRNPHR